MCDLPDVACMVGVHAETPHDSFELIVTAAVPLEEPDAPRGTGGAPFVAAEVLLDGPWKRKDTQEMESDRKEIFGDPNVEATGICASALTGAVEPGWAGLLVTLHGH